MPQPVEWPGANPDNHSAIALQSGSFVQKAIVRDQLGPWGFFRLLEARGLQRQGDGVLATVEIEGRQVTYRLNVNSIRNPLMLSTLREFSCPSKL